MIKKVMSGISKLVSGIVLKLSLNPFHANVPFISPLKMSEN